MREWASGQRLEEFGEHSCRTGGWVGTRTPSWSAPDAERQPGGLGREQHSSSSHFMSFLGVFSRFPALTALIKDLQQSRGYHKHIFGGGSLLLLCPGGSHAAPKPQLSLLLPPDTTELPSRSQRLCKEQAHTVAADARRQDLLQAVLEMVLHPSIGTYMDCKAAMVPSAKIQVVLHQASPADTQLLSVPSSEEKGKEVALYEVSGYGF